MLSVTSKVTGRSSMPGLEIGGPTHPEPRLGLKWGGQGCGCRAQRGAGDEGPTGRAPSRGRDRRRARAGHAPEATQLGQRPRAAGGAARPAARPRGPQQDPPAASPPAGRPGLGLRGDSLGALTSAERARGPGEQRGGHGHRPPRSQASSCKVFRMAGAGPGPRPLPTGAGPARSLGHAHLTGEGGAQDALAPSGRGRRGMLLRPIQSADSVRSFSSSLL